MKAERDLDLTVNHKLNRNLKWPRLTVKKQIAPYFAFNLIFVKWEKSKRAVPGILYSALPCALLEE